MSSKETIPESTSQPTHSPSQGPRRTRTRLYYLDSLRVFLTTLVIYHHTAIVYGGLGSWLFHSQCSPSLDPVLATFNVVNQTFFMALFFWMAGYFSHLELTRPGDVLHPPLSFIKGRARRLLIPSISFTLVLAPMMTTMVFAVNNSDVRKCRTDAACHSLLETVKYFLTDITSTRGVRGPVWFCVVLFIFDTSVALLFWNTASLDLMRRHTSLAWYKWHHELSTPRWTAVALLIVTLASWVLRITNPVGTTIKLINTQPAFLPQYIFAYILGHFNGAAQAPIPTLASPLRQHERPAWSLIVAILGQLLLMPGVLAVALIDERPFRSESARYDAIKSLSGGTSIASLIYCAWNEIGFITVGPALVAVCRRCFNQPMTLRLPAPSCRGAIETIRMYANKKSKENGHDAQHKHPTGDELRDRKKDDAHLRVSLARYAFSAFLLHPLVSLAVEVVVEPLICRSQWPHSLALSSTLCCRSVQWVMPLVMTTVVGTINVLFSWLAAITTLELLPTLGKWV